MHTADGRILQGDGYRTGEIMTITLDWRGGMVRRRMSKAVANGMDKTMAQAVNYAKPTAPVLTGAYQPRPNTPCLLYTSDAADE